MYYEKILKQKKSACKKSLLFDRKNTVFFGKSGEKTILSGKIIWKNVIKPMVFQRNQPPFISCALPAYR